MTTRTFKIPLTGRDSLLELPVPRGLTPDEQRLWSRARRGLVPTALEIELAPDLGRLGIGYRYGRDQGRAGGEIELAHGTFRSYRRSALLARAQLRRAGPRRAAKAHAEYAELLRSLVTYACSLPDDYQNRWRLLATATLAAEHWRLEKERLSRILVAPTPDHS